MSDTRLAGDAARARPRMLLVEPDTLVRRTVASVARQLDLADVQEATGYEAAADRLSIARFDALLLALRDDGGGIDLVEAVRAGRTRSAALMPIAVMATHCDAARAQRLLGLKAQRILLKPFKVKTVLETIGQLAAAADLLGPAPALDLVSVPLVRPPLLPPSPPHPLPPASAPSAAPA